MLRGRLGSAIVKEFRQFVRDPVLLFLVLWLYTAEIVLCAFALTFDLDDEAVAILDLDHSRASRELADRFERSEPFRVVARLASDREVRRALDRGDVRLAVVIPAGYAERLTQDAEAPVQLVLDGTNSMTGRTILGQARGLLAHASEDAVGRRGMGAGIVPRVENRLRVWYNPDLRFVYFVVISILAIGAYMVGVIHPAASIVKEKESGTIEQLIVSPLRPLELVLAKTLPTFAIGLLAFGPALLIARAFGVPFRGDPLTFLVLTAAFLISAIATGVLIASLVRTLQQALLVSFFVLFPVTFLSGTMTPIESMPPAVELLSRLSPLRYYVDGMSGVFLKGVGLEVLWRPLAWMLALGAGLLATSAVVFRRRLV